MSEENVLTLTVESEHAGLRLDSLVSELAELSRSAVQRLCDDGQLLVNGKSAMKSYKVCAGDTITLRIPPAVPCTVAPEDIALDIVYEDAHLLVVNKPKGMVVHPAPGNETGTLVSALLHHCGDSLSGIGGELRPGIVHRLDKDTSGLMVVAKNGSAHIALSEQLSQRSAKRIYSAIVHGNVKQDDGTVDAPVGRHPIDRKRMCVTDKNAREAISHYCVEARYGNFTLVTVKLETGRTHQIRVHMAYIGHHVAGDRVYGPKKPAPGLSSQCLHAGTIGFMHPASGEYMTFSSALPEEFAAFLAKLERENA